MTDPLSVSHAIIAFARTAPPAAVLDCARMRLLDSIGVAVAGATAPPSQAIIEAGKVLSGQGPCHVLGSDARLGPAAAALVNGALIHTLDFDDTHLAGSIHPSAAVIGASLAAIDLTGGTVGDLLRAIAIGTEVACWLSEISPGELHARGFLPTAVLGAVGGAVAASVIFGLDDKRFADAIGLASAVAAGFFQLEESWVKNWNGGWAANAGISAAVTARVGYNGPLHALEGPMGFFAIHTSVRHIDPSTLAPKGAWRSEAIALKRYSCCHFLQSTIDCALELGAKVKLDEIERIVVAIPPLAVKSVTTQPAIRAYPVNTYRARFAGHWVVSRALTDGLIDLSTFEDYAADRPDVVKLVGQIEIESTDFPNFPRDWPSRIDVHNRDGSVLSAYSAGEPVAVGPTNENMVLGKFASNLAFARLDDGAAQRLARATADATLPAAELWRAGAGA